MIAARSACTDKDSFRKARKTLLLHLVQLGLSLSSTLHNPLIEAITKVTDRLAMCLSALIYGIRDQTIRPILLYHLCCRLKLPAVPAKAKVSQ
ncbi:hypothetical protein F7725_024596 [Dissostichus mawsoni]|uniref:Uncharacterized protein n=1 Tax=Dissostichus mawsoni TaxID=36200 RepID=A0A7J5X8U7_DISMA|nr:hypothetical protein F7725_024596 [Dissostichus mawsoni]